MKKETSLVFTGDIGFDHYMDGKWKDPELLDADVRAFLTNTDHLIVNVEGALSNGEKNMLPNSVAKLMHSMDPDVATFLHSIDADIWNLANNHIMDAGAVGMADTLAVAKQFGAQTIGAGMNINEAMRPVILQEAGGIGMFGVGYQRGCKKAGEDVPGSFPWNDMEAIRKVIADIKKTCRWCIVVAHGGEEFTSLPSPYTRDRYLQYLEMGADIVVSHHPHVPMNYETVGDKVIFYSLGNFIFDTDYQRAQFNTEKGVFVKLLFTEDSFSYEPFGIVINRENEHVEHADLPLIFRDVNAEDYDKLIPLSSKAFVEANKKQQVFLFPDKYANATEEMWRENFLNPKRSGRVEGEGLDFFIILPIAQEESKKEWQKSDLEDVKEYILQQL